MPEKKSSPKTKADIDKKKPTVKKSSVVKKELSPLTAKETKKTEKKSVTLLKEAINTAKNKALDNEVTAKPIKKRSTSVKKTVEKLEKPEKEKPVKKDTPKETYTKADMVKPSVFFVKEETEAVDLLKSNSLPEVKSVDIKISDEDHIMPTTDDDSTYTKESILSVLTRDDSSESKEDLLKENTENVLKENKEDLLKESIKNLQDKIKLKQEEEEKIKKEIETRTTTDNFVEIDTPSPIEVDNTRFTKPVSTPSYSYTKYMKPEKKESKKPFILILGIILVIAGVSFGVFKFVLNDKENTDVPVTAYVEEIEKPVETATENTVSDIEGSSTNITENSETLATNVSTEQIETPKQEEVIEEAPKQKEVEKKEATVIETPPTPVAPTPPTPTAPKVLPPVVNTKALTKPYIIAWKDTLQGISESELGDIRRWPTIYSLNKNVLKSPDSYAFGTTLAIPIDKTSIENMSAEDKASLYNDYLVTIEAYKKINNSGMVIILEKIAKTLK